MECVSATLSTSVCLRPGVRLGDNTGFHLIFRLGGGGGGGGAGENTPEGVEP